MFAARQTLHSGITSTEVQEILDKGARVVFAHRAHENLWDVIVEITEEDWHPEAMVHDFLAHVDPELLEKKMLENPDMNTGIGKSAIQALRDMVPRGT